MKVIIVGAGIGGLTTALCLHSAGIECSIFESTPEIKPLGVGINLLPHAVRVLTQLGLQDRIADQAIATTHLNYYNKFGQLFWSEARGKEAGYKWPQYSIHRGVLQNILLEECKKRIGAEHILCNHQVTSFVQTKDQMTIQCLQKGSKDSIMTYTGEVLIGADGIHSAIRRQLYPQEGPPVYSENVLYRGVSYMDHFLNGSTMVMIGSMQQKMVVYPIVPTPNQDGLYMINWVANLKEGKSTLLERDWNRLADKNKLLEKYHDWSFSWLDVPEMITRSQAVYEFPMSDRDPLSQWTFGRVTLLGDAAHPMYPIGSNGASQAILDAAALVEKIKTTDSLTHALWLYEQERLPATTKVVLQNRAKGPDQILDIMEDRFPSGFTPLQIPHDELKTIMDSYRKIAGFDVQELNAKN